jgi:hypothetical protein
MLDIVWEVYARKMPDESPTPSSKESPSDQHDDQKMIQFLEATLDGNIRIAEENNNNDDYSMNSWHRLVLLLFDTNSKNAPANKILDWIGQNKQHRPLPQDTCFGWHEWIMKLTVENIARKKQCSYLRDPKAMNILHKIMIAHAVSPQHDALRSLSWQTISAIVHEIGWTWNNETSTNAPICTWTRLATGEWKILIEKAESGDQHLSPNNMQTLDGCGLLMMAVIEYLTSLDERPDFPLPLEAGALMHLKQALEDTFSTTSHFLHSYTHLPQGKADSVIKTKTIEFWCRLAPEFELDNQRTIDEGFLCMETLLQTTNNICLMRPLLHHLCSAENDETVKGHLSCISSPISNYIRQAWEKISNNPRQIRTEQLSLVCSSTEIMLQVLKISTEDTSLIRSELDRAIQSLEKGAPYHSESISDLKLLLISLS